MNEYLAEKFQDENPANQWIGFVEKIDRNPRIGGLVQVTFH